MEPKRIFTIFIASFGFIIAVACIILTDLDGLVRIFGSIGGISLISLGISLKNMIDIGEISKVAFS